MTNYIPVDKLKAEIESRMEDCKLPDGTFPTTTSIVRYEELSCLRNLITSLQQEPRFPQYDNIVDKVFGAGNLEGFEYREAEMLVALAKEELLKSLQQEQTPTEREIAEAHRYAEMIRERDKARIQQKQPEPSNNLVDVDAVREDFITEVYRVLDADPTNDRANAIIDAFDSLPTVSQEQPEVELEKASRHVYESWMGGTMDDVRRDMIELGRVINARKEGLSICQNIKK